MGWWDNDRGENQLKGVPGDLTNPPRISEEFIIYCLQTSSQARAEFFQILPTLLPEETARLEEILELNPGPSQFLEDPQTTEDNFQRVMNTQGVRTQMPRRS